MDNPCMSKIWPGVVVIAYWHIEKVWKPATVISRYGILSHEYCDGCESGNYPDMISLRFHDGNPPISEGHFTYGVVLRDCYLTDCPECKKGYIEKAWYAVREVALGHIRTYSHKDMCKLLKSPKNNYAEIHA